MGQEVLDDTAMDVDEVNMDFSNAYVDTKVDHINVGIQPQGLAEEAEVKVVYRATRRTMTILCWIAQRRSRIRGIYYHKTSNDVADL
jgi:hypothetical protein